MDLFAGLDIGSTATKCVLLNEKREIVQADVAPSGANCRRTAHRLLAQLLERAGAGPGDVRYAITTGYGRRLAELGHEIVSEITANATGARWLSPPGKTVRTVIDIGGQDSKVISLDEQGRVVNFAMNDKCAAGTGRFLEVIAQRLELNLEDLGKLHFAAKHELTINSVCTVFAESEVVSLLAQGREVPDIVAGIHRSVAKRVGQLVRSVGVVESVMFDGGPAQNRGVAATLSEELGVELLVPDAPQLATALGAALIACERAERGARGEPISLAVEH